MKQVFVSARLCWKEKTGTMVFVRREGDGKEERPWILESDEGHRGEIQRARGQRPCGESRGSPGLGLVPYLVIVMQCVGARCCCGRVGTDRCAIGAFGGGGQVSGAV